MNHDSHKICVKYRFFARESEKSPEDKRNICLCVGIPDELKVELGECMFPITHIPRMLECSIFSDGKRHGSGCNVAKLLY